MPAMTQCELAKDEPLRLAQAVALAFPHGGMTVAGLRTEARRGRLVIEKIAGKDFVTLRAIEEMRAACRVQKAQGSGFDQPGQTGASEPSGLSGTDESSIRLAALEMTLQALKKPSKNTLPESTTQLRKGAEIRSLRDSRTCLASTAKRSSQITQDRSKQRGEYG